MTLERCNAETVIRVPQVAGWIVDGVPRREIHRRAADQWGLRPRAADELIRTAKAELVAGWHIERAELCAVLLERADRVFELAMEQRNAGAAVAALMATAKLAQL